MGFPRFKVRHRARPTCRFTTGPIRVEPDRHHITLPRLGQIRTHESTRKLVRRIEYGTARILAATISRTADRWYVSFTVEVQRHIPQDARVGGVVGADVGIRHLAVLSTGQVVPNPRPLEHARRQLRRVNRQLARRHGPRAPDGTRRLPSIGWRQTQQRLGRVHARVAHIRSDGLHQLTTRLATRHDTIVVEHLNVAGMMRNRHLARMTADVGFAALRRQLAYKTAWYGSVLITADPWYPSSKTCSACGTVKAKLPLSVRVFRCDGCGISTDRDLNAARNLAQLVQDVARSGLETQNARGADQKTQLAGQVAMKREAGTSHALGKTGTAGLATTGYPIAHRQ
jgi:putative transposase